MRIVTWGPPGRKRCLTGMLLHQRTASPQSVGSRYSEMSFLIALRYSSLCRRPRISTFSNAQPRFQSSPYIDTPNQPWTKRTASGRRNRRSIKRCANDDRIFIRLKNVRHRPSNPASDRSYHVVIDERSPYLRPMPIEKATENHIAPFVFSTRFLIENHH